MHPARISFNFLKPALGSYTLVPIFAVLFAVQNPQNG